jgi:glycerol-3-phosphate acyltransferase PlsX
MKIVVDAMGSDTHPGPDVSGAVMAARESTDTIILVGSEPVIRRELDKHQTAGLKLEVVDASEVIHMDDKPGVVGKGKPNSSMHVGMNMVKDGVADAFVTVGNTGAAYAIAMLFTLRRIPGVVRPALSAIFPVNSRPVIFLDVGANADSKPDWLAQFAIMGNIYAQNALGLQNPRIGLLSNGEEEGKGNQLILDANTMMHTLPLNFVGNIEPKEAMQNHADVVVSDGFTGNILVKTFEASMQYLGNLIRHELRSGVLSSAGGLLTRPAFRRVREKTDTLEVGGAPLLGVNGVVIIGHGRSDARAVRNAIRQAQKAVEGQVIRTIEDNLAQLS